MFKKLSLIAAVLLSVAMVSCQKVTAPSTPESVALATHSDSKAKSAAEGTQGVTIYATSDWSAAPTVDWITVSPSSGGKGIVEVVLSYEANTTGADRTGCVIFSSNSNSEAYILKQSK